MKIKELTQKIRTVEDLQRRIKSMMKIIDNEFEPEFHRVHFMIFDVWAEIPLDQALLILEINVKEDTAKLADLMTEIGVEPEDEEDGQ